jgi:putative ABC transport system substrate-binding protein
LHDLLPKAARFVALVNSKNPPIIESTTIAELQEAASSLRVQVKTLRVSSYGEIEGALENISLEPIDALLVSPGQLFGNRVELAALLARRAIPAMYYDQEFVEAGGLISYGSDLADQYRETGVYTGRILKGERPSDIPVMQATKFKLVINLKTAKALDLEIPPTLLARADEVVE